jgi:hypothetical protein
VCVDDPNDRQERLELERRKNDAALDKHLRQTLKSIKQAGKRMKASRPVRTKVPPAGDCSECSDLGASKGKAADRTEPTIEDDPTRSIGALTDRRGGVCTVATKPHSIRPSASYRAMVEMVWAACRLAHSDQGGCPTAIMRLP